MVIEEDIFNQPMGRVYLTFGVKKIQGTVLLGKSENSFLMAEEGVEEIEKLIQIRTAENSVKAYLPSNLSGAYILLDQILFADGKVAVARKQIDVARAGGGNQTVSYDVTCDFSTGRITDLHEPLA